MTKTINEMTLNEILELSNKAINKTEGSITNYVIIRTQSAGVFAGVILKREGDSLTLQNARRLWYWKGAASLSQLAQEGTSDPKNCQFPCEVSQIELFNVIEILSCTEKARKSIASVKVWEA